MLLIKAFGRFRPFLVKGQLENSSIQSIDRNMRLFARLSLKDCFRSEDTCLLESAEGIRSEGNVQDLWCRICATRAGSKIGPRTRLF